MPNIKYPNLDQTIHGESGKTPEYNAWKEMKKRCYYPAHINYANYGGRGIKVCLAWRYSYTTFLRDMGRKPNGNYSLDRTDNNKNYAPKNCRWSTAKEQAQNRRASWNIKGCCLKEYCEQYGLPYKTVFKRLASGWSIGRATHAPIRLWRKR